MNDYFQKWCCLIIFNHAQSQTDHLFAITSAVNCAKHLYYDLEIKEKDKWSGDHYKKYLLTEDNEGERMKSAFANAFADGFRKVVLIKNKFEQLQVEQIMEAFNCLKMIEFCIGPESNGDYYLIGMNYFEPSLFNNKQSDTTNHLKQTIRDIGKLKLALYKLPTLTSEHHVTNINS